jgi:hypothetical protein
MRGGMERLTESRHVAHSRKNRDRAMHRHPFVSSSENSYNGRFRGQVSTTGYYGTPRSPLEVHATTLLLKREEAARKEAERLREKPGPGYSLRELRQQMGLE